MIKNHHRVANIVTMAWTVAFEIVLAFGFGHWIVETPSFAVSQKHVVDEYNPAPVFCCKTQDTITKIILYFSIILLF